MKNSPSCAHVLHKTLNLVISRRFADDGKEVYNNALVERLFLLVKPIFCGVLVAVAVVVA